jgi:hypothetical protein
VAGIYRLNAQAAGYDLAEHNFFDPGFQIRVSDGTPYFFTADDAFAYRFTAYAFSGLPLMILRYTQGHFVDQTNGFAGLLRKDARRFYRRYRHTRNRADGTQLGVLAAWAADQYRLGNRAIALQKLRHEARAGRLKGPDLHGMRYVRKLNRFLKRRGY